MKPRVATCQDHLVTITSVKKLSEKLTHFQHPIITNWLWNSPEPLTDPVSQPTLRVMSHVVLCPRIIYFDNKRPFDWHAKQPATDAGCRIHTPSQTWNSKTFRNLPGLTSPNSRTQHGFRHSRTAFSTKPPDSLTTDHTPMLSLHFVLSAHLHMTVHFVPVCTVDVGLTLFPFTFSPKGLQTGSLRIMSFYCLLIKTLPQHPGSFPTASSPFMSHSFYRAPLKATLCRQACSKASKGIKPDPEESYSCSCHNCDCGPPAGVGSGLP